MSLSDFEILNKLGEGAFSNVFKVKRKSDNTYYALKKVKFQSLTQKEKENALNEVRVLASLNHPSIISYKEAFLDESTNTLCIVLEYAEGGDLLQKITQNKRYNTHFSESLLLNYTYQIISGLKHLHDLQTMHRDLKCANIFLSKDGDIKLGDLNICKVIKRGLVYTQTGTPYYASPEIWQDKPYDYRSDIWSLGCVIYELAALHPPFQAQDMQGLCRRILRGEYPPLPRMYSAEFTGLIRGMLQVNPRMRPNCETLLTMPCFSKLNGKDQQTKGSLLGTIKLSPNLRGLSRQLPAPNYERKARHLSAHPRSSFNQIPTLQRSNSRGRELQPIMESPVNNQRYKINLPDIPKGNQPRVLQEIQNRQRMPLPSPQLAKPNYKQPIRRQVSYDNVKPMASPPLYRRNPIQLRGVDRPKQGQPSRPSWWG